MSETLELNGLSFEVRRSTRRRTLGVTVDRNGELVVHAPCNAAPEELASWTRKKLLWVHRKLGLKDETIPKLRKPEYFTGESFAYLGKCYRLALVDQQKEPLRFTRMKFLLRRDAVQADDHFRQWYIARGKPWLQRRVELMHRRTGPPPTRIVVRDLGYRWGSCGRDGTLYFNWRVLQLPVSVIDYVILHELCHLLEPNHGPAFWNALERALPDWRRRKDELHRQVSNIYWCTREMIDR
jgi:predicted metal-dependent hydrolase